MDGWDELMHEESNNNNNNRSETNVNEIVANINNDEADKLSTYSDKFENDDVDDEDDKNYKNEITDEELTYYEKLDPTCKGNAQNNRTFSNYELREIDKTNEVLMKKVMAHTNRKKEYKTTLRPQKKMSSAEINRKKQQQKIDNDNMKLLKKIQSIKAFGMSKSKK